MRDFEEFEKASKSGFIIARELMKFDNPDTFRSILCASIEMWAEHNGYNPLEVIATMDDAMHSAHRED